MGQIQIWSSMQCVQTWNRSTCTCFFCVCFVVVAVLFFACLFFKYYREKRQEKCLKNVIKHFYSNNDILCGSNHVFCCALFWLPAMTSFQFPNSAFLKTNGPWVCFCSLLWLVPREQRLLQTPVVCGGLHWIKQNRTFLCINISTFVKDKHDTASQTPEKLWRHSESCMGNLKRCTWEIAFTAVEMKHTHSVFHVTAACSETALCCCPNLIVTITHAPADAPY